MKPLPREVEETIRRYLDGDDPDWDWDDTNVLFEAAMNAMAYWRERCEVAADDVAREGVTPAKRTAYLRTVATEDRAKYSDYVAWTLPLEGCNHGIDLTVITDSPLPNYENAVTARVVADVARGLQLSPWAVLAAMAETENDQ